MDPLNIIVFALGSAIGGIFGNRTDAGFCQVMYTVVERLRRGGKLINHDLQRAVRKAYLQATLLVCEVCLQKLGTGRSIWRRDLRAIASPSPEVRWLDAVRHWIHKELRQIPRADYLPPSSETEPQIELLLQPRNTAAQQRTWELSEMLKQSVLEELRQRHGDSPASFVQMVQGGWDDAAPDGTTTHLDWFDLLCAFFVYDLKNNEKVRTIFEGQLLTQLTVEGSPLTLADLENQFEELGKEMTKRLSGLDAHLEGLRAEQVEGFAAVQECLDEMLPHLALLPDIEAQQQMVTEILQEEAQRTREHISTEETQTRATLDQRFAELQITTDEQARSLQAEIARLSEMLRRQSERAHEVAIDPIPIPLPALRGTFVDRDVERDTLRHLLRQSDMRLVVIVAPGGYGKTELTTKILKEVAPSTHIIDPDVKGILYLRCLRGDLSLGRIFAEAGRIVGKSEPFQRIYADRDLTLERKLDFCFSELSRAGNVWVVMDNFEDLLADDDTIDDSELRQFVETAMATEHTVRLIATTRALPRFQGSQRLRPIDLREGLPEAQAVEYLRAEGADYGMADADEELLRAFVNRVYRIPKALESVIGYLAEKYPVVQLSDLMANDALFADFDNYDAENGLRRLLAEQFADQTPDARLVLCALSIFPRPAPLAALRYLLPALDWTTILPRLVRNRLINSQGDRFDLHPLVQEYAYGHIPSREGEAPAEPPRESEAPAEPPREGEAPAEPQDFTRPALHARAADFFAELRKPTDEWKTIADLEPQLDEFYHRVRAEQYDAAAQVLDAIDFDYLQLWGHARTVIELREQLLGKLTDTDLAQVNVGNLGLVYMATGRVREAIPCLERALQQARDENDQAGIGRWLGNLGVAYSDLGKTWQAIEFYQQALAISREIDDRRGQGIYLGNLGNTYFDLGETRRAIEFYEQGLAISREIDDRRGEGIHQGNLGAAYFRSSEFDTAIGHYTEAVGLSEAIGDKGHQSHALCSLGVLHHHLRNLTDARRCYEDALALDIPSTNYSCAARLGILCLEEGKAEEARDAFARSIALCRELLEKTPNLYEPLYALALAQLGSGQWEGEAPAEPEDALATYRRALEVCSAKGVVQNALQELRLLERAAASVAGLAEAVALLESVLAE